MTAAKAIGPNLGLMTAQDYQRGCSEVKQVIEYNQKERSLQKGLHELAGQVGQLQLSAAQQLRENSAKLREDNANLRANKANLRAEANHEMLMLSLAKVVLDTFKQMPPSAQNPTQKPVDRAKQLADKVLKVFEAKNLPNFAVFVEASKCMKLTPGIASTIIELLKELPNCVSPDLSKFQDQIDPEALKTLLVCKQINKIVFAKSVQNTPLEQQVKQTRQLEIAFA